MALEVHPLTPDRWDLAVLFDRPGDARGCWCRYWRVRGSELGRLWGTGAMTAFEEVGRRSPTRPIMRRALSGRGGRGGRGGSR